MQYIDEINKWLADHKSTTLPNWLKRNPSVLASLTAATIEFAPVNVMEMAYIALHNTPTKCKFGNYQKFNTFVLGYRKGCILGNKCQCIAAYRQAAQKTTLMSKYGVDTVGQIPGINDKRQRTNLEKFGVNWPAQCSTVADKSKITRNSRTAEDMQITASKSVATSMARYGVSHHMKSATQINKVQQTNQTRYQTNTPLQNKTVAAKLVNTLANKSKSAVTRSNLRRAATNLEKFGVPAASQIPLPVATLTILNDKDAFILAIRDKTREEARSELGIATHTLYLYAKLYQVADLFAAPSKSNFETEVAALLTSMGIAFTSNNRTLIAPKELDFVIPSLNIAIECSGLYWHSEMSANRTKQYHHDKFVQCAAAGITLITIFDDEWIRNTAKVKARLTHILHSNSDKIAARKCVVKQCSVQAANTFIDKHHLQGATSAKINLALYYNDEMVSVMTLSKPRYNKNYQYEILRFCSSKLVTGAASKLFAYFLKTHAVTSVISYSDNRWGNGKVYSAMQFIKKSETIGYFYTDYKHRYDRTAFQKHKLVAAGADSTLTEWQIMQLNGYDRVWDCGQSLWVYEVE